MKYLFHPDPCILKPLSRQTASLLVFVVPGGVIFAIFIPCANTNIRLRRSAHFTLTAQMTSNVPITRSNFGEGSYGAHSINGLVSMCRRTSQKRFGNVLDTVG
jgi:hypothetical protein